MEERKIVLYGKPSSNIYMNPRTKTIEIPEPIDGEKFYRLYKNASDTDEFMRLEAAMVRVTDKIIEFINGWKPFDIYSRYNIRECAWSVVNDGKTVESWALLRLVCHVGQEFQLRPGSVYYRWNSSSWIKAGPRFTSETFHRGGIAQISFPISGVLDLELFFLQDGWMGKTDNIVKSLNVTKGQTYTVPVMFEKLEDVREDY
jgi:hypothetical protein